MRGIRKRLRAQATTDGAGVRIRRIAAAPAELDPFLLIDEIRTDAAEDVAGGFPPHPHRGFETLTYVRAGGFAHEDSLGHKAAVGAGQAQWMRAGRGVVHSEMPLAGTERFHGFQLWINLPAAQKMSDPAYCDIAVPELSLGSGAVLRPVTGRLLGAGHQAGHHDQSVQVAELELAPQGVATLSALYEMPAVMVLVFDGQVQIGGDLVARGELALLDSEGDVSLESDIGGRVLILAGVPVGEPVVQHGPFVMNSAAEIQQAIQDYRDGTLG